MSFKFRNIFIKISYAFSSNLLSLLVSMVVVLIVPKIIGINEFGYWQLYLFYVPFVGFLHFGWSDGVYLREGGKSYNELDKKQLHNQFIMLTLMQLFLALVIFFISFGLKINYYKRLIYIYIIITMFITNVRSFPIFVLQATNRMKEYAHITIIDRIIYLFIVLTSLQIGVRSFEILIVADILSRSISLMISIYYCNDITMLPLSYFKPSFSDAYLSIRIGIKLMLAYIASALIIGVVRYGIERVWNVETFGKISLILSASNIMMPFINAFGLILFPILRKMNSEKITYIYSNIRDLIMVIFFGLLTLYYPIKTLLGLWLPNYSDSIEYMVLVFPMFIFEGKTALLINTYMKVLRKERLIMNINIITLFLSVVLTYIFAYKFRNLELTILMIVVLLAFKSLLAEISISKILNIKILKENILEVSLTLLFILSGWYIKSWQNPIIYGVAYTYYILVNRKNLCNTINQLKHNYDTDL